MYAEISFPALLNTSSNCRIDTTFSLQTSSTEVLRSVESNHWHTLCMTGLNFSWATINRAANSTIFPCIAYSRNISLVSFVIPASNPIDSNWFCCTRWQIDYQNRLAMGILSQQECVRAEIVQPMLTAKYSYQQYRIVELLKLSWNIFQTQNCYKFKSKTSCKFCHFENVDEPCQFLYVNKLYIEFQKPIIAL